MSVEGFFELVFQILDSSQVTEIDIVPGHMVEYHAIFDRLKAYDLLGIQVGQHLVQQTYLGERARESEAAPVAIGVFGPAVKGELMGVLQQDLTDSSEVFVVG